VLTTVLRLSEQRGYKKSFDQIKITLVLLVIQKNGESAAHYYFLFKPFWGTFKPTQIIHKRVFIFNWLGKME